MGFPSAPGVPEPFGLREPVQRAPDLKRMRSPGRKVVELIFSRDFQASAGVRPVRESSP